MMNMDLKENDVILARDERGEKWQTTVFHSYDTSFDNEVRCRDTFNNDWREAIPLKGNEDLQNTSLPADGWKPGDLCVYRACDGMRLGFFLAKDDCGFGIISDRPMKFYETLDNVEDKFCIPMDAIFRPEIVWPWWSGEQYSRIFWQDKDAVGRVLPV